MRLPGREDCGAGILRRVYDWLCAKQDREWIMVLDNVDDARVFFDSQVDSAQKSASKLLYEYLPESSNGSILITIRSRDAGVQFTGRQEDVIDIEPMEPTPAFTLLEKKLGHRKSYQKHHAQELIKALDHMPLAISQAAAYICKVPAVSVASYPEDFIQKREGCC